MTTGKVWGEDMILQSAHLRSKYAARCMTYVEVYMISRDELLTLARSFPPTLKIIRRSAFRLAFRREMIRRAQSNIKKRNEEAGHLTKESTANRMLVQISSKEQSPDDHDPAINSSADGSSSLSVNPPNEAVIAGVISSDGGAPGRGGSPGGGADAALVKALLQQHSEQQQLALSSLEIRIAKQHETLAKQMETLATRLESFMERGPSSGGT